MPTTPQEAMQLLLQVLRQPADTSPLTRRQAGSSDVTPKIIDLAIQQGLAPLLYSEIKEAGLDKDLPPRGVQRLREAFHHNAACNLCIYDELREVLEQLALRQVPVIVLKGAYLAVTVYPNQAARTMGDVDILVHAGQTETAVQAIGSLGYRVDSPPWINVGCDVELVAPDRMATVELHWGLTPAGTKSQIPVGEVWETAVETEIAGRRCLALAPEELLLYLCYHTANKHLFMQGLRSLIDVDRSVRFNCSSLDWDRVQALSQGWGLARAMQLTLHLCHGYLDTPIPQDVLGGAHPEIDPELINEALARMSVKRSAVDVARAQLFRVGQENKPLAGPKLLLERILRLPHPPYGMSSHYPAWKTAYHVLRRLLYLVAHYAGAAVQLAREGPREAGKRQRLLSWLEGQ